jgi:uncharacterized membrane protein YqhA
MIRRILEPARHLVLFAVISSLVASAAAFLWGAWKTALVIIELATTTGKDPLTAVRLIELMDKFLIAAGLYIFAVGIYELFFGDLKLPQWLMVHNLHDIKSRLSSIVVLVMAISFLERLLEWQDPQGTLFFAIGITLVTAALIAFSFFGEKA